ncbi:hypothetical protein G3I64_03640 [Streptomyces sp. SID8499]|nr:hypothetical protein [Streptomyces sp. SID8499]
MDLDPGLRPALLALVEPDDRGDPMSRLRWTVEPTRSLAAELSVGRERDEQSGEDGGRSAGHVHGAGVVPSKTTPNVSTGLRSSPNSATATP